MNNMKSFQRPPIVFAAGAIIGLLFGLWIGWGLWPVEWQGGSLRDLGEADKAEYIAAVADAFVIYDTPEAAANARQRLAIFGSDLDSEFVNAIRYFQSGNQPERAIRMSNIGRLANSLGLVPPDLQGASQSAAQSEQTSGNDAPATLIPTPTQSALTDSAGISWVRWLLWLLAALLLLSGGLYLMGAAGLINLQQLTTRLRDIIKGEPQIDEFPDEEYRGQASGQTSFRQGNQPLNYVSEADDLSFESDDEHVDQWELAHSFAGREHERADERWQQDERQRNDWSHQPVERYEVRYDDELYQGAYDTDENDDGQELDEEWNSFEDESDEDYERFHTLSTQENPAHFTIESFSPDDSSSTPSTVGGADENDEQDDEDDIVVPTIAQLMAAGSSPIEIESHHSQENDNDDGTDLWDDEESDEEENASPIVDWESASYTSIPKEELNRFDLDSLRHSTTTVSPQPTAGSQRTENREQAYRERRENTFRQSGAPAKRPKHQLIDQHTLSYQMGMAEYDESKPIVDAQSDKYIGEFGMGTSEKNGAIQPNSNYVAALEVWLFDKSDEKNMGNQTRIMMSEYAVDHHLEQTFTKERTDNPRPFTPQPGVHFQLESQNLLLDCTIVDVKYLESGEGKGMFGSIRVDMSVHKKS